QMGDFRDVRLGRETRSHTEPLHRPNSLRRTARSGVAESDGLRVLRGVEIGAKPLERAMQRYFDGVRLHTENVSDLPCSQIRSVAQRHQVSPALVETLQSGCHRKALERVALEILGRNAFGIRVRECGRLRPSTSLLDTTPCDTEQPRERFSARRVIALAVAQRTLE